MNDMSRMQQDRTQRSSARMKHGRDAQGRRRRAEAGLQFAMIMGSTLAAASAQTLLLNSLKAQLKKAGLVVDASTIISTGSYADRGGAFGAAVDEVQKGVQQGARIDVPLLQPLERLRCLARVPCSGCRSKRRKGRLMENRRRKMGRSCKPAQADGSEKLPFPGCMIP
jgi:hypothetical protein